MRLPFFAIILATLSLCYSPRAKAEVWESDDTLKFFLSKSELVVSGRILKPPLGMVDSIGIVGYFCEFQVNEILKGDSSQKPEIILVTINRFEINDPKDKHPLINMGSECILFLKPAKTSPSSWQTADYWFGVQPPWPMMESALRRLAQNK